MKKDEFAKDEMRIVGDALVAYKDEVKKMLRKAERLNLPQAESLKMTFLSVEALRDKVTR